MSPRTIVCTIGFLSGENIQKLWDSISYSPYTDLCVSLNSSLPELVEICQSLRRDNPEAVYLIENGYNAGCSYAWNEMIHRYIDIYDCVIICNDDIEFGFEDADKITNAVLLNPKASIVSCGGTHVGQNRPEASHGYSCFAITKHAIETVGYFDENIKPAYLEDCDWSRRASLLGVKEAYAPGCQVRHYGSWSINHDRTVAMFNHHTHGQNFIWYHRKWGKNPGEETYLYPFNNPDIPLKISYEVARDPYRAWGFSRREM